MLGTVIWPLVLISGLGLGLLLLWVWLRRRAEPERWMTIAFWCGEAALGALSLWYSWRLKSPAYFLIYAVLTLPLLRLWQHAATARITPPVRTGRMSILQSPWLMLRLDHDSGACSGQMLRGILRDWQLQEMDHRDLQQTRGELRQTDPIGTALFDLWLDRHGPINWAKDFNVAPVADCIAPTIDPDTAYAMLGLDTNATPQDIAEAAARLLTLITTDPRHAFLASWIKAARAALPPPRAA